ncbi:MAG: hypothetical protein IKG04_03920, partial [Exiguobacterium sp.]|nr:hypothetical protein [Exiguobacterium sp.]
MGLSNDKIRQIVILADIADGGSYTIEREVTIDGNSKSLTSSSNSSVFNVNTSATVKIQNLNVYAPNYGISVNAGDADFTLESSTITAKERGIHVVVEGGFSGTLNVVDSVLQLDADKLAQNNGGNSDYETATVSNYERGISVSYFDEGTINVTNSTIRGFWAALNFASDNYDANGATLNVTNSTLMGRAGINTWPSNMTINVLGGRIHGIHNYPGPTEAFANIVLNNSDGGTTLNVSDVQFTNYLSESALDDDYGGTAYTNSAAQYMIANRATDLENPNVVNIYGNTSFEDYAKGKTGRINTVFEPHCGYADTEGEEEVSEEDVVWTACPEMNIYGGVYPYDDVRFFVDYEKDDVYYIEADDVYVVTPKTTYSLSTDKATVKYDQPAHVEVSIMPAKVGGYDNPNLDYTVESNNEVISFDKTTGLVSTTSTKETSGVLTFTFADESKKTVAVSVERLKVDVEEDAEIPSEDEAESVQKDAQEVIDSIIDGEAVDSFEYAEGVDAEEVLTAVAAGDDFGTVLNADEISAEDVDVEAVDAIEDEMKEGAKLAGYFDVNVALVNLTQDKTVGYLTELSGEVTVTVAVPEDVEPVKEGFERSYYVIRYHDDAAETLDTTNNGDGTISFKSSKFSTYALAYIDNEKKTDVTTPDTG